MNVNANTYNAPSNALALRWFAEPVRVDQLEVYLTDPVRGFVQASRLIAGLSWQPAYNPDWGVDLKQVELGKRERLGDGGLMAEAAPMVKELRLALPVLPTPAPPSAPACMTGARPPPVQPLPKPTLRASCLRPASKSSSGASG